MRRFRRSSALLSVLFLATFAIAQTPMQPKVQPGAVRAGLEGHLEEQLPLMDLPKPGQPRRDDRR